VILFFAAYKLSGWNAEAAQHFINTYLSGMISGGSVTPEQSLDRDRHPGRHLATMAQIGWIKLRGRKVDGVLWVSLAMFVVFGGLTIYLHDEDFIKWKLSIVYWLFARPAGQRPGV
jgi:intracellular septation protein